MSGPKLWNKLPCELKHCKSLCEFRKKNLKHTSSFSIMASRSYSYTSILLYSMFKSLLIGKVIPIIIILHLLLSYMSYCKALWSICVVIALYKCRYYYYIITIIISLIQCTLKTTYSCSMEILSTYDSHYTLYNFCKKASLCEKSRPHHPDAQSLVCKHKYHLVRVHYAPINRMKYIINWRLRSCYL